ncbi:hypothetical protein [Paenibacillus sp. Mc5Re-14]|uniref:hypothetical protein n=1 Tax=Paenibacillus sp. Mc5Re-14 TaxID=1030529 RepID=UPI000AC49523|nr:hypothetical protein [Paenibacillus sp. Mc5Re-14]
MQDIDLKLKLFTGRAINAKGYGDIAPLTVREIVDIGYSEYMKCLNIMTLTTKDFLENPPEEIHVLELLMVYGGQEIESAFEQAMALFLGGTEVVLDKEDCRVFIKISDEEILIVNKENYHEIQEVIKWQNYINSFDEKKMDNFDPADEENSKVERANGCSC